MEELIDKLRSLSQLRHFKKGSTVLFQGEIPRRAFIVREGVICAYTIKASGEQMVVAFFTKDDILPLPWLLNTSKNSLLYYEAVEDAQLISFSKADFTAVTSKDPSTLMPLLEYLGKQYTSQIVRITSLGQSRAIEKISFTLYYLLFRYGVEETPGVYSFSINLSHLTIANLTGLTRESTTTNLKILKDKKVIDYSRPDFKINKRKLEDFIGEDGFRELSL